MSLLSKYTGILQTVFSPPTDSEIETPQETPNPNTEQPLKSELSGISDESWAKFVKGMITSSLSAVSPSNALGMFEMMPRRLADLGLVNKLSRTKATNGRTIWTASFISPMTSDKFLKSPQVQYKVFSMSMKNYVKKINRGAIEKDPEMSLSGALAILHKAGPNGLKTWKTGERFQATQAIYDRISDIF